jgi:hypothetical protein
MFVATCFMGIASIKKSIPGSVITSKPWNFWYLYVNFRDRKSVHMENHCTRLWVLLTFFNQLIKQISELNRFGQLSISKWGINIISRKTIEWTDLFVSKGELALHIPKQMLMNILALSQWKRAVRCDREMKETCRTTGHLQRLHWDWKH